MEEVEEVEEKEETDDAEVYPEFIDGVLAISVEPVESSTGVEGAMAANARPLAAVGGMSWT